MSIETTPNMIPTPTVLVACFIAAIVVLFSVLLFAPVKMMLNAICANDHEPDESELNADYSVNAQWPADALSREFEQEPRGM